MDSTNGTREPHQPSTDQSNSEDRASLLIREYQEEARNFLSQHLPQALDGLDRRVELTEQALALKTRLDIGFVGESQVGKSTLLNAILGAHALPSGGIGPLTAQPILVRYAERQSFVAHYHTKQTLNELRFAIEEYLRRQTGNTSEPGDQPEGTSELIDAVADESHFDEDMETRPCSGDRKGEELLKQLRVMFSVTAEDEASPSTLVDALRVALGQAPVSAQLTPRLDERASEIASLIGQTIHVSEDEVGRPEFLQELNLRAAGWQSPLVNKFDLQSNSEILKHVNLVDLPGVGTINDPSQATTQEFVRTGDALAVVVRNNGVTEAVTQLLERSGYITRLLFAGDPTHPPIHMLVVVTHLDNTARTRRSALKEEARARGERAPTLGEVFQDIASDMEAKIREQLLAQLRESPSFAQLSDEALEKRSALVDALTQNLRVHCVVAPDALELQVGDEEDANIKSLDATGVPGLARSIIQLADDHLSERSQRLAQTTEQLETLLRKQITNACRAYEEDSGVVGRFVRRFREVREEVLPKLREQMQGQNGRVYAVLTEGLPRDLESLSREAEIQALKKLQWLKSHGEGLHFASLNAALRRSGRWDNRGVDYPGHLTRVIVDTIAGGWVKTVVDPIREIMGELVDAHEALVEEFVGLLQVDGTEPLDCAQIEAQIDSMRSAAESCVPWTDGKLDQFRDVVSKQLLEQVEQPIAECCRTAIEAGRNRGKGAKRRILEVFNEAGGEAIETAGKTARRVLDAHYQELLAQLTDGYLRKHADPLKTLDETVLAQEQLREANAWQQGKAEAQAFRSAFLTRIEPPAA
jgi:hypothetical protein